MLLVLWVVAIAFAVSVLATIRYLTTTPPVEQYSNVIVLPPRCERGGPTHVVRLDRPRLFDQDALA